MAVGGKTRKNKDSTEAIQQGEDHFHFYRKIGIRIRAARESKGITNDQLAVMLDRSGACVIMWQNGKRTPSLFELSRTAKALGVPLTSLLMDSEELVGEQYRIGYYAGCTEVLRAIQGAVEQMTSMSQLEEVDPDD